MGKIFRALVRFEISTRRTISVICPRRIESYVKYAELAYDPFHLGLIFIIDHRGRARRPGVMLSTRIGGHVDHFNDYVEDLAAFWQQEIGRGRGA